MQCIEFVSKLTKLWIIYCNNQSKWHDNVGFITTWNQRIIYIYHVDTMHRLKIKDSDAEGTLAYLCGKVKENLSFYCDSMLMKIVGSKTCFWQILL